jgi:hypothetical protein
MIRRTLQPVVRMFDTGRLQELRGVFTQRLRRRINEQSVDPDRHASRSGAKEDGDEDLDLRYVYRVVVDGERDDTLLVRDEPVTIEAEVPFRGRTVIVERIEDLHEADARGDVADRLEARPEVQIVRRLVCRDAVPISD